MLKNDNNINNVPAIIPQRLKTTLEVAQMRSSACYGSNSTGSYEVTKNKGRRRNTRTGKTTEAITYNQRNRDKAQGTIYDLFRNDVTTQWAFNKFLDYSTVHYFQSSTDDTGIDSDIETIMEDWMSPANCDVSGRHSFDELIRLMASGKALDGDCALLKTHDYKLQGIEGDNIRSLEDKVNIKKGDIPPAAKDAIQGLILDDYGRVTNYIICTKSTTNSSRYDYRAIVPADSVIFDGNFFRFDQLRGVPILNAAANTAQDIKEIDEYQLIKVKKHAMFGIAFKSDAINSGFGETKAPIDMSNGNNEANDGYTGEKYQFEMDAGMKMELNPGDSVDMFESKTPSTEYREFSELMIRKFLLTFGLPFEFFNPQNASYSTMKHVRAEFKFGIQRFEKRNRLIRAMITKWVLPYLIQKNKIKLNKKTPIEKVLSSFVWLPQAEPWLEEDKEVSAALARIGGGLSNYTIEAARHGNDAFDIFRGAEREQTHIQSSGLVFTIGQPGQATFNADKLNKTITVNGENKNAK